MSTFLTDYGQWALAVTGIASVVFVLVATFLELNGPGGHWGRVRFRFFRWWKHELTAAQVLLSLGLAVVLLPSSLYILFGIDILNLSADTTTSMWYHAIGLTYVCVVEVWRSDATMRAKARERRRVEAADAAQQPRGDDQSVA